MAKVEPWVHLFGYSLGYRLLRATLGLVGEGVTRLPYRALAPVLPAAWEVRERFWPQPASPGSKVGEAGGGKALWAHCASLGEAAGLLRLLEHLNLPQPLILTAQTAAGLVRLRQSQLVQRTQKGQHVRVLVAPFESKRAVARFLAVHRVSALLIYESEWWPAYLETAKRRALPTIWLGAQCSRKTLRRWSRARCTARYLLEHFDFIQARSPEAAKRLRVLTRKPVAIGFDAKGLGMKVLPPESSPTTLPATSPTPHPTPSAIASLGMSLALYCLHADEWPLIAPEMPALMRAGRVIVLPRKQGEFEFFRRVLKPLGFVCRSESDPQSVFPISHLLVDALGVASEYLAHCDAALVGGSLHRGGGHAFFEPLAHGLRLFAGPSLHQQEPMARTLRKAGLLTLWRPGTQRLADLIFVKSRDIETDRRQWRDRIHRFFEEQQKDWELALEEARKALLSLQAR
jgi:3-deoxy-D-manno-octulosonic-acid transferase